MEVERCLKFLGGSCWLCEPLGFDVGCLVEQEWKLEVNLLKVECSFHKVLDLLLIIIKCCHTLEFSTMIHQKTQQNNKQFCQIVKDKTQIQLE